MNNYILVIDSKILLLNLIPGHKNFMVILAFKILD